MDAVVAVYEDWGIGCGGTQPIVVPADRKHFREVTGTGTVIVGRRTLADFPGGKPLKNRLNIVLTRSGQSVEGALTAASVEEALALEIVDTWLGTEFSGEERHQRRIDKLMALEK